MNTGYLKSQRMKHCRSDKGQTGNGASDVIGNAWKVSCHYKLCKPNRLSHNIYFISRTTIILKIKVVVFCFLWFCIADSQHLHDNFKDLKNRLCKHDLFVLKYIFLRWMNKSENIFRIPDIFLSVCLSIHVNKDILCGAYQPGKHRCAYKLVQTQTHTSTHP